MNADHCMQMGCSVQQRLMLSAVRVYDGKELSLGSRGFKKHKREYKLAGHMAQSSSWEAYSSPTQEIPRVLWNKKVY